MPESKMATGPVFMWLSPALLGERRRLGELLVRRDVVLAPARGAGRLEDPYALPARRARLVGVELEGRDAAGRALPRVVVDIAGQEHRAALGQADQQDLVTRRMARRGNDADGAV